MKLLKKTLSVVLLLSVVLSLCACSGNRVKQDNIVKALENQDFDECDDYDEFTEHYGKMNKEQSVYVTLKDNKAQKAYDKIFNRLNKYPSADVTDATCGYFSGTNGFGYVFFFQFEDTKKAEKVFKKYTKDRDDADDGEEKGITYSVSCVKKNSKYVVTNAYLEKDKVLIVYGSIKDTDILEDFCDELKLPTDF